jgi:hypothetical protein
VRAWNEHTLEQIASEPIPAGTRGIVLRATADGWRPIVDGVVVALDGTPLEGLRCRLSMDEYRSGGGSWMTTGQEVKTDAQGRFVFHDVPPAEVFLRIDGQGCGVRIDLAPDEECRNRRIEVATSGEFILEVTGSARGAFAVCVLDDAGKRLELERQVAEGLTYSSTELTLSADGTCRARVSELARWLVLLDDGREIARLPLHVRHGAEARVRW